MKSKVTRCPKNMSRTDDKYALRSAIVVALYIA